MVPPITLHKSLNYKKLIDIIFNLVFTAGTILNDTIYIKKKIILTPTIKIWVYRLMLI